MSGGSKTQTTTNQTIIPEEVKPLLSQYMQQASGFSNAGQQAQTGINTAFNGLMGVAAGDGYNQNPYFDQTVQKSMGDITRNYQHAIAPQTNANFARAGAFGGSAWGQANERNQLALGEALGNTSNAMRSGNYSQERQNQLAAMQALPGVGSTGLGLLGNAVGVGMGGAGSTSTGANPNYRSPFQTALGLGGMVLGAPQASVLGGLFGMGK